MKKERLGLLDYIMLFIVLALMFMAASCTPDDIVFDSPSPKLELNGETTLDSNGYYHLTINKDVHQTIHKISGIVENHEYYEPLKVEWDSNLTWVFQGEDVSTSNQVSYVINGKVQNVIAPINTMIGDTLILTGRIWYSDKSSEWAHDTLHIVLD